MSESLSELFRCNFGSIGQKSSRDRYQRQTQTPLNTQRIRIWRPPLMSLTGIGNLHPRTFETTSPVACLLHRRADCYSEILSYLESLGFTDKEISKIPEKYFDKFLLTPSLNTIRPVVTWLQDQGICGDDLLQVIVRNPSIVTKRVSTLQSKVDWLCNVLLIPREKIPFVVSRSRILLNASIAENLAPTLQYFEDTLSLSREQVGKVVAAYPHCITLSLERNIIPTIQWLKDIGIEESQLGAMILRRPSILNFSIDKKLRVVHNYLCSLGLTASETASIIRKFPSVLTYSLDSIKSKISYLREVLGRDVKELVHYPSFLGLSLKKRLRPREAYLDSVGVQLKACSLYAVFATTDSRFATKVAGRPLSDFLEFKDSWDAGHSEADDNVVSDV